MAYRPLTCEDWRKLVSEEPGARKLNRDVLFQAAIVADEAQGFGI